MQSARSVHQGGQCGFGDYLARGGLCFVPLDSYEAAIAEAPEAPVDEGAHRRQQLQRLFEEMDLDNSGFMDADEVSKLAQTRRKLYQKEGDKTWTEAMNNRLLKRIDTDGDGRIDKQEFVDHYTGLFETQDSYHFNTWFQEFLEVVHQVHAAAPPVVEQGSVADELLPADTWSGGVVEESLPKLVVDVDEILRQLTNWMMCGEAGRQRLAIARRAAAQIPAGCSITKDVHPRLPLQHPPRQVSVTSATTMRIRTDIDRY